MLLADAITLHDTVAADLAVAQGAEAPTMTVAGVTVDTADVATWVVALAAHITEAQSDGHDDINTLHCADDMTAVERKAIKAVNFAAAHS